MSKFSGKCDLYDTLSMYGDDELEAFRKFKKATDGTLYQHRRITVTKYNREWVKKNCTFNMSQFDFKDNTYTYWGVEYKSLKSLNKVGVYVTVPIHFNTLLDLIPYYPYIISEQYSNKEHTYIFLSRKSYVETMISNALNNSISDDVDVGRFDFYKEELQKHYLEVCEKYIFKDLNARTHYLDVHDKAQLKEIDEGYLLESPYELDDQLDFEYEFADGRKHTIWTWPKRYDATHILLSKEDVEQEGLAFHSGSQVLIKIYEILH